MQEMDGKLATDAAAYSTGLHMLFTDGHLANIIDENLKVVQLVGGRAGHLIAGGALSASQLVSWLKEKPAGFEEDEDSPLVDGCHAGAFFGAAVGVVTAEKGAAALGDAAALDVKSLYPSWENDVDALLAKDGLSELL